MKLADMNVDISSDSVSGVHDLISKNENQAVKSLINGDKTLLHGLDENGLSPLEHACFKGNLELATFLLKLKAPVNMGKQKQGYSALMFACLSGNIPLIKLLLEHGARIQDTNSLGKTCVEMAGFVGNFIVVAFVNNYVEKREIRVVVDKLALSFTQSRKKVITQTLYDIIIDINFAPVNIMLKLCEDYQKNGEDSIISNGAEVLKIFDMIISSNFTAHNTCESICIKCHIIQSVVQHAIEISKSKNDSTKCEEDSIYPLKSSIKRFLACSGSNMMPLNEEKFLRHCLSTFPHRESNLWQILVKNCASIDIETSDKPIRFTIMSHVSYQSPMSQAKASTNGYLLSHCACCSTYGGNSGAAKDCLKQLRPCSVCKSVVYCDKDCQKLDWFNHKKFCPALEAIKASN